MNQWGKLKIWGTDESGNYWESEYSCFSSEIDNILAGYENYEDYDFYKN